MSTIAGFEGAAQTASYVKENPGAAGTKLVNSSLQFGHELLSGDVRAVGKTVATGISLITGGALAKLGKVRAFAEGADLAAANIERSIAKDLEHGFERGGHERPVTSSSANSGTSAAQAPPAPTGDSYTVAFQTELKPTSYPNVSRGRHFQEANENLLRTMEGDQSFAQMMQGAGVNLQRTATGLAPRTSPTGWTWHHAEEPGILQLVPRVQHTPGSVFWDTLHPDGKGGYAIWGQ